MLANYGFHADTSSYKTFYESEEAQGLSQILRNMHISEFGNTNDNILLLSNSTIAVGLP